MNKRKWTEKDGVIYFSVTRDDGTAVEIAVLKGETLPISERTTERIRIHASKLGFMQPDVELSRIIDKMFTKEEIGVMGLRLIVSMDKLIVDSFGVLDYLELVTPSINEDQREMRAINRARHRGKWERGDGFAFVSP